ncbi:MAG: L-rhamnose/proton symporter RhaT [Muribaculaceae bacterium]
MEILFGLLIIAIGSFCQSSSYVPIRKVKQWSWESFWLVQGIFAWIVFPIIGAMLAVPEGESILALLAAHPGDAAMTALFGVLWGIGGLTFGLSMRYLGVALGQSISLGTCAALGTILGPVLTGNTASLTSPVLIGVAVTLVGISVIGAAGSMRQKGAKGEEKQQFNFTKGITVAIMAGLMSACFNIGLEFGAPLHFDSTPEIFSSLIATMLVTMGGFVSNAAYCLYQNSKNRTWSDYSRPDNRLGNILFCALAGVLWYSQFFGLSLGKGFLAGSATLITFSWCILMALNVTFSNVWGIILKEWKGCNRATIAVLVAGLAVLILSSFLPQLL